MAKRTAKTADTTRATAANAFAADVAEFFKQEAAASLDTIKDPERIAAAGAAIADLAAIAAECTLYPDRAAALQGEAKFSLSTLASIAAQTEAEIRQQWQKAAWSAAQKAAHFIVGVILA